MNGSEKIPITVGVVGHLDALTTNIQKQQIEKLFKDLASEYPNSPVYLFSSVAEGADRFVADIFLNLKRNSTEYTERFELIIPLPFDSEEYRKDFKDDADKEFFDLLKQAKRKFIIGCDAGKSDRAQRYLATGKFVADSSLILIAIWDGQEGIKGGTSDIVNYKRKGDDNDIAKSIFEYEGSVFILQCNRKSNRGKDSVLQNENPGISLEIVLKDPTIKEALEKIEEINSDSLKINQKVLTKSQCQLISNQESLEEHQKSLIKFFSMLDVLSVRFHGRYTRTVNWLFLAGLLFVMSFSIYTNLWLDKRVLAIAMLLIVLAGVLHSYSRFRKDHMKYLNSRALTEALRIQFYWNLAGINHNVSDYILKIHRKELAWIEHILSSVYGTTYNNCKITNTIVNNLATNWVKKQADFFDSSIKKMTQKISVYQITSNSSFIAAAALLLSIFFLEKFYITNNLMNYLQVVIGTLLGIFALIRGYIQIKGYSQLLNQYELMKVLYRKAETKINSLNSSSVKSDSRLADLKELFFIIGTEALIENGIWYLILKDKEPGIEGI